MQPHRYTGITQTSRKPVSRYVRDQSDVQRVINVPEVQAPAHGSYGGLLFDQRWKTKRAEVIARDNGCCVICMGNEELLVHHRQYHFVKAENAFKVPWDYPGHLLITLCKSCHQRGHSKFKVPILFI